MDTQLRAAAEALQLPTDGDSLDQLAVFVRAMDIFVDRRKEYGKLWKVDGWRGSIFHVRHKFRRMWKMFWLGEGGSQIDVTTLEDDFRNHVQGEPRLDDAFDLLNYDAFFIRNVQDGNENGQEI